jgi:zinc finger CCHC domain-containing protein 8
MRFSDALQQRMPTLILFTGPQCSLCDVAKESLGRVRSRRPFTLKLYNIRDDSLPDVKRWRRAYQCS